MSIIYVIHYLVTWEQCFLAQLVEKEDSGHCTMTDLEKYSQQEIDIIEEMKKSRKLWISGSSKKVLTNCEIKFMARSLQVVQFMIMW